MGHNSSYIAKRYSINNLPRVTSDSTITIFDITNVMLLIGCLYDYDLYPLFFLNVIGCICFSSSRSL